MPIQLYAKEKILDACLALFARHGYANTSTAMLAGAAGISKALLFHHFRSKKELYLAILAQCIEKGRAAIGIDPFLAYADMEFFAARERFSLNKVAFNRQNPDAYQVLKEAFFATPKEIKAEIEAMYGVLMVERHTVWQRLFAKVPLRAGVDRAQAFELIMLTLDYFDKKFLANMADANELDETYVQSFLEERKRFLAMIRYGIEQREDFCDDNCGDDEGRKAIPGQNVSGVNR